jgi:hypothetical protein
VVRRTAVWRCGGDRTWERRPWSIESINILMGPCLPSESERIREIQTVVVFNQINTGVTLKTFLSRVVSMTIVIEIVTGGGVAVVPMSRFYF